MTNLIDKVKEKTKKEQIVDLVEGDTNLFAQILKVGIEQLMEAERDDYIGVDRYDRSRARKTSRNGYKTRQLYTRVGKVVLRVPKTRDGEFYPAILNRYERSEKALVFALAESYVQGVSTRKMAAVTEELLGKQFSSQTISNFAQQLDAELDPWRNRSIEGYFPYVTVDARYEHCRRDGKIVDMAVLVAVGVNEDGKRHVLGVETGWGESEAVWKEFIAGLKARGLKAPLVFTSDAHPGIRKAIRAHYPGVGWQRCQFHFMKNFLEKVPKQRQEACKKALHQIWEKENSYDQAKALLEEFVEEISSSLPKVAEWLSEEAEWTLTVYREAPSTHRKRLRTTNSVERLNQEMKRRGRAVRIFPNSESCIRLYSALLKEQHEDWITGRRYLKMEQLEQFQKRKALDSSENSPMNQEKETMAL